MTTDLQSNLTNVRPPQPNDAYAMAALGLSEIFGVTQIDGKSKFLVAIEKHPNFRQPQLKDAYAMAVAGVSAIKGVIESAKDGCRFVKPEERYYAV